MKFLDGYIVATTITGVVSLINHLTQSNLSAILVLSPVIVYIIISIPVSIIKTFIKTKG